MVNSPKKFRGFTTPYYSIFACGTLSFHCSETGEKMAEFYNIKFLGEMVFVSQDNTVYDLIDWQRIAVNFDFAGEEGNTIYDRKGCHYHLVLSEYEDEPAHLEPV